MKTILVTLPADRFYLGQLFLADDEGTIEYGPVPVDGKSDNTAAIAAANPTRDPLLPFGDTPLGDYVGSLSYIEDTPENRRSYGEPGSNGKIPTIDLMPEYDPQSQAWKAYADGRRGLKMHAGDLNNDGDLRPTFGCLRVKQADMTAIVSRLDKETTWVVSVKQKEENPT